MRTGTHDITLEHGLEAPPAAVFDSYVDPVVRAIDRPGHLAFESTLAMPDGAKQ